MGGGSCGRKDNEKAATNLYFSSIERNDKVLCKSEYNIKC